MGVASSPPLTVRVQKKTWAWRVRATYAGCDSSTSDSESSEENMAKALASQRKKSPSQLSGVPYIAETSICPMKIDDGTSPNIQASSTAVVTESETMNFEDETTGSAGEKDELVSALASVFKALLSVQGDWPLITLFYSVKAPTITIGAYLTRLSEYFDCSDACLLTSLILIDRIVKLRPAFPIFERTIHRIIAVSFMISAKFNDDVFYSNRYYAKVCGLTVKELNGLEYEFLRLLQWNCGVTPQEYEEYRHRVFSAVRNTGC